MVDTAGTGQIRISPSSRQKDLFGGANCPAETVHFTRRHPWTLNFSKHLPAVRSQRV
ncbi:hypothetical protein D3C87_1195730 [compost metagenome]